MPMATSHPSGLGVSGFPPHSHSTAASADLSEGPTDTALLRRGCCPGPELFRELGAKAGYATGTLAFPSFSFLFNEHIFLFFSN